MSKTTVRIEQPALATGNLEEKDTEGAGEKDTEGAGNVKIGDTEAAGSRKGESSWEVEPQPLQANQRVGMHLSNK